MSRPVELKALNDFSSVQKSDLLIVGGGRGEQIYQT